MNSLDIPTETNSPFCQEVKTAFEQLMAHFSMDVNKELNDEIYLESQWAGIFLGKENNELTISIYNPKGKSRWYPINYLCAFFALPATISHHSEGGQDTKPLCAHAQEMKECFQSILRGDFSWSTDFEKWLTYLKLNKKDQEHNLPSFLQLVHEGHIQQ
jgi:hypothetical protein